MNNRRDGNSPTYPIDYNVQTTAQRTVVLNTTFSGTILPQDLKDISKYDQYGYGVWTFGPGLAHEIRTDIMPDSYSTASVEKHTKLLNFFTMTDVHITDKESPMQLIYLQQLVSQIGATTSVYSPVMMYTTQMFDAAIQTVNVLHKTNPFDFGLFIGDAANSTQYNEVRWYIDVLDGKVINPSSGANVGSDTIDYQKPFKSAGLDRSIPWYQTVGNHDHFFLGSFSVKAADLYDYFIGDTVFAGGNVLINPLHLKQKDYYMGVLDCSTPNGDIINAGPVGNFTTPPKVVADPNRRSLSRKEWIAEFLISDSYPAGHGFTQSSVDNDFGCYSFVPKSNIPIKVIVLDDTQNDDDGSPDIHGHGFLDQARWDWLKKELADGSANNQLMIISAHVPIAVCPQGSEMEWWINPDPNGPQNAVTISGLIAELQKHPNLLMWLAGHRHFNTIKAFVSTDPAHPENGFWQVETSSLRDFPQQFRQFEIYVNSDNTISIVTTNIDPSVREGTPAAKSRKYAVATQQIYKNDMNPNVPNSDPNLPPDTQDPSIRPMDPTVYSYNAELIKQLTPAMQQKLAQLKGSRNKK
jgi:metallophosphoesterase (TIGR03768 family)